MIAFPLCAPLPAGWSDADRCQQAGPLGADLASLASGLDAPVPDGLVLSTDAYLRWNATGWDDDLDGALRSEVAALEQRSGRTLGSGAEPLLLAVRPSVAAPLWGLVRPLLDLGAGPAARTGLVAGHGPEHAFRSHVAFVISYAAAVGDIGEDAFARKLAEARTFLDAASDDDLPVEVLDLVAERLLEVARAGGVEIPSDPHDQLVAAVQAAFERWGAPPGRRVRMRAGHGADEPLALVVQSMVPGEVGAVWSHDPTSGRPGVVGDVLDGAPTAVADRVAEMCVRLSAERRDAVGLEVAVGDDLWVLSSTTGAPVGAAAIQVAVDLATAGVISRDEALLRVGERDIEHVLHDQVDLTDATVLATGLAASPGAAVGEVVFSADDAVVAASAGRDVILVRPETSPEDVHGMTVAVGILTTRGGLASHAAVVARGWGKPAVCGADGIDLAADHFIANGSVVRAGEVISIDGSSGTIALGEVATSTADRPEAFDTILAWADQRRAGRVAVRANADTGADAAAARAFGAEGIGLCRTEHMFLGDDRLPIARQMILAATDAEERIALTRLRLAQKADFVELLEAMDGLPVTVRLLDPPLHEFLPDLTALEVRAAAGDLDDEELALLGAARRWHEQNPMIGTRGVRLGWLKPGLYQMQVRALLEAVVERAAAGGRPIVEVMIPLTVSGPELAGARRWVTDALAEAGFEDGAVMIGTMIETPRAALLAAELAEHADFFSFGTNDLSQLTFGFSRDDVEGRLMALYLDEGLLAANPFETLDPDGVGELVRLAAERGRVARPGLKLGVCGEHGGDPASVRVLVDAGVDYVSCSPYRVPVARLAVAQALVLGG